jgi:hypothetical protein
MVDKCADVEDVGAILLMPTMPLEGFWTYLDYGFKIAELYNKEETFLGVYGDHEVWNGFRRLRRQKRLEYFKSRRSI